MRFRLQEVSRWPAAIDPAKEIDFHHPLALPEGRLLLTTHLHPTDENQTVENTRVEILDGEARHTVLGPGFAPVASVNGRHLLVQRFGVNPGLWAFGSQGIATLRPEDGRLVAAGAESATAAQDGTFSIRSLGHTVDRSAGLG